MSCCSCHPCRSWRRGRVLLIRHPGHDDGRGVPAAPLTSASRPPRPRPVRPAKRPAPTSDCPAGQTCLAAPVTKSATPAATAPPASPLGVKPGSSAVPRHQAMASSASPPGSPRTVARPEAELALPRPPPHHRPPLIHSAPRPPGSPLATPIGAPPNARNAAIEDASARRVCRMLTRPGAIRALRRTLPVSFADYWRVRRES